ncbi:MAG: acetyl-CoA carboxylase, carboxyltransferase subunit beta [Lachnospiraceae bacterium]|nr:acetyl-CoA carboxylase, carboxyltransferase subunit beta [Lachnospiraceae bacterium]
MLKFKKPNYIAIAGEDRKEIKEKAKEKDKDTEPRVPEGLWIKCPKCGDMLYKEDVISHSYTCYKCGAYFRVRTKNRLRMVLDKHSFEEWDKEIQGNNPLKFPDYEEKLAQVQEKTKLSEAITCGKGKIYGMEAVLCVCDSRFIMGSMGQAVGEKLAKAFERATEEKLPVICFCCSGGARMQEGMVSLMQMAKTSAAIKKHSNAGLLYISVLTDPTTGGVTASFAMLGDIILAEPGALIGFAGPRVIEQTIGQKLPEGFQRAEFLLEHGFIDRIVKREDLKSTLHKLLQMHQKSEVSITNTENNSRYLKVQERSAWERVQLSRASDRATALDYVERLFTDFLELSGDRLYKDDKAIAGGIAFFQGMPVTVIGIQKGRNTKENIERNFGMPSPEGYRKALRLMKQAEKFGRMVINFVDTPGAFCGMEAEERGQGEAIARNLLEMSDLKVPVLSVMIGEGGSGGALALAVANEVIMLENATYSILSPEGFASILWKDGKKAKDAAEVMKITAKDLKKLGIIDEIIYEKEPVTAKNMEQVTIQLSQCLSDFIDRYQHMEGEQIAAHRYERFRRM